MEKDLNYLFNNIPLYVKNEFKIFEIDESGENYILNKDELGKLMIMLSNNKTKLITRCVGCNREFPFIVDVRRLPGNDSSLILANNFQGIFYPYDKLYYFFSEGSISSKKGKLPKECIAENLIQYLDYTFICTNDSKHIYKMILSVEEKDGKFVVRKIGQNPSMVKVKGYEFDKYKPQLKRFDAYDEYCKADLCYNESFNVGAYAYLRRVFEKMLNDLCKNIELKDNHVDTKIDAVKEFFDPEIRELLKNMYSVVSASIHAISENESEEYYEELKAIIDIQLEYMKTEEDRQKQIQKSQKTLSRIISKYGKM